MNKKIKIEPFIERLNNTDFKQGTKFKFLDKIYLYDFPNLVGVYEIGKPTKPEYSIFAQLDMTNLHCEVEILEDNTEEIEEIGEYSDLILMSENERVLFNMIKVTTHKVDEIIRKLNKLNTNKD